MRTPTTPPVIRNVTRVRFDIIAFFRVLDSSRRRQGLSWKQVAEQTGVAASTLTRIGQGHHPDLDNALALAEWLGLGLDCWVVQR